MYLHLTSEIESESFFFRTDITQLFGIEITITCIYSMRTVEIR